MRVAQPSSDCLFPVCITPRNTGFLYMQCDKTSSILNFCFCCCWGWRRAALGIGGWGGSAGSWQWPDGGMSDRASSSPLHDYVPARQHAAICWTPPPHTTTITTTPQTLHPAPPHPDAAITTDSATS